MQLQPNLKGLLLALTTAVFWGALPIALKQLVTTIDPVTIVWLRFTTAALWLWLVPPASMRRSGSGFDTGRSRLLLAAAAAGLGGNFVLFNASVVYLSAGGTQIIAQAGPMLLLLGSVLLLREPLIAVQVIGAPILVVGLGLFFNEQLGVLLEFREGYGLGLLLGFAATVVWAIYGLSQRILLREIVPSRLMRAVYTCNAVIFFPFASPGSVSELSPIQILCLVFCCANTLAAYGSFSKAMTCCHTAKVSAVLTTTPLFTLAFTRLLHTAGPQLFPADPLNWIGYCGAGVVVSGAALIAVGPLLVGGGAVRFPLRRAGSKRG